MQQIERYGVIALVFLLVTIVAVSFWGDSKSPGFWARLTGKGKKPANEQVAQVDPLVQHGVTDPNLPLTTPTTPTTPLGGPDIMTGNVTTPTDMPPLTTGLEPNPAPAATPNPFGANPVPQPGTVVQQPLTTPVVPITPEASSAYVVQKGDSLASIARKKLGAESRWVDIQAANNGLDPRSLQVGATIILPAGSSVAIANPAPKVGNTNKPRVPVTNEAKKSKPVAPKTTSTYTVKKGDGLRAIARTQLGDESRWKEILSVNPGLKADRLQPGDKIKLPTSKPSAPSTGTALASVSPSQGASIQKSGKPQVR